MISAGFYRVYAELGPAFERATWVSFGAWSRSGAVLDFADGTVGKSRA
jgi:hypothetical protein